jgi:hypothetical protein
MEDLRFTESVVCCSLALLLQTSIERLDFAALRQLIRYFGYSTVKGAVCAISCFETLSFTIIFTRYFPG